MSITFPINTPTSIGMESIELRAVNAVALSSSPFTFQQQVHANQGQRWEASINLPSTLKDKMAPWKAFLISLKGQTGTFLLGDPDYDSPQGTATSATITGSVGDESVTVAMTGTLLAGDYIQLGSGSAARLHTVLQDQSGNGTLEIWPKLRAAHSLTAAVLTSPKGNFRLASNITSWSISNSSTYGISFDCVEVI